jgi:small-conductance mechanosensitive channel
MNPATPTSEVTNFAAFTGLIMLLDLAVVIAGIAVRKNASKQTLIEHSHELIFLGWLIQAIFMGATVACAIAYYFVSRNGYLILIFTNFISFIVYVVLVRTLPKPSKEVEDPLGIR